MNGVEINRERITVADMEKLQKAYEEREKNMDTIIFDSVIDSTIKQFLAEKIGPKGPATTFSFCMDYQGYILGTRWWINNRWVSMTMDDSKSQKLLEYTNERLTKMFPDYVVVCEFKIKNNNLNIEELELELIDFGLEEIGEDSEGNIIIRTAFNEFGNMSKALEEKGIEVVTAEPTRIPVNTVELSEDQAQEVLKMVDKLEQDEDVQKVYHNLK